MQTTRTGVESSAKQSYIRSGIVTGIGLGGFFDGIVLHQLLQWHHLVSTRFPPTTVENLQLNTLWDGIFHALMYIITLIGFVLVWRAIWRERSPIGTRLIFGASLIGWGIFNTFDSIVNHWILGVHHIRETADYLLYDIGFFIMGLILIGVGAALTRIRTQR